VNIEEVLWCILKTKKKIKIFGKIEKNNFDKKKNKKYATNKSGFDSKMFHQQLDLYRIVFNKDIILLLTRSEIVSFGYSY
jgi:hypothetical protein